MRPLYCRGRAGSPLPAATDGVLLTKGGAHGVRPPFHERVAAEVTRRIQLRVSASAGSPPPVGGDGFSDGSEIFLHFAERFPAPPAYQRHDRNYTTTQWLYLAIPSAQPATFGVVPGSAVRR